jgi:hypothetical protein
MFAKAGAALVCGRRDRSAYDVAKRDAGLGPAAGSSCAIACAEDIREALESLLPSRAAQGAGSRPDLGRVKHWDAASRQRQRRAARESSGALLADGLDDGWLWNADAKHLRAPFVERARALLRRAIPVLADRCAVSEYRELGHPELGNVLMNRHLASRCGEGAARTSFIATMNEAFERLVDALAMVELRSQIARLLNADYADAEPLPDLPAWVRVVVEAAEASANQPG